MGIYSYMNCLSRDEKAEDPSLCGLRVTEVATMILAIVTDTQTLSLLCRYRALPKEGMSPFFLRLIIQSSFVNKQTFHKQVQAVVSGRVLIYFGNYL